MNRESFGYQSAMRNRSVYTLNEANVKTLGDSLESRKYSLAGLALSLISSSFLREGLPSVATSTTSKIETGIGGVIGLVALGLMTKASIAIFNAGLNRGIRNLPATPEYQERFRQTRTRRA